MHKAKLLFCVRIKNTGLAQKPFGSPHKTVVFTVSNLTILNVKSSLNSQAFMKMTKYQ